MRLKTLSLTLGLALATVATGADAGDWNNGAGGLKDNGGPVGIPVPAPIPYAETFKWYLRADIGGGWIKEPKVTEKGMTFGYDINPPGQPFGTSPSWFNPDFDTFAMAGLGVGLYLTPRLRADITIDARTKSQITADGNYSYIPDPALVAPNRRVDGKVHEQTDVRRTLALANLYWDLVERGSRFVPYIGLGAGLAVETVERSHNTSEAVYDTTVLPNVVTSTAAFTGKSKAHQLAPAAAATVGVGYTLSPGLILDVNYRYTYIGEVDFSTNVRYSQAIAGQSGANSRMTIGDTSEHAIRAGVRWNVW